MAGTPQGSLSNLFVISGSHGVGKSTTLPLVVDKLKKAGYSVHGFHHRLKERNNIASGVTGTSDSTARFSLRRAWRRLPKPVRLTVVALLDAHSYAHKISSKVKKLRKSGSSAIADRYVYDQLIELSLRKHPFQNILAFEIASRLMQQPSLTIMLTDCPERIPSRNPELSVAQNAKYQDTLLQLLRSRKIPYQEISVFRRTPEEVANEVSSKIIDHLLSNSANK